MVGVAALMRGLKRRDVLLVSDSFHRLRLRLVVAGASDALPLRVVVTAVDRFGTESAARVIEKQ